MIDCKAIVGMHCNSLKPQINAPWQGQRLCMAFLLQAAEKKKEAIPRRVNDKLNKALQTLCMRHTTTAHK